MFHLDNNSGIDVMPEIKQTLSRQSKWFTEGDTQTPPSYPGADWFNIVQAELLNVLKTGDITPQKAQLNQLSDAIRNIITKNQQTVKLNSSTNSTSETEAATPLAVKKANDNAVTANANAISANSNANNAHNRINEITDKFTSGGVESRVYSNDKRFYLLVRDDGMVGMYNTVRKNLPWGFTEDGVLVEGYVPADRVLNLEQYIRNFTLPPGIPLPWPQVHPPAGWFECNGAQFDINQFPRLASAYPAGRLPDLRGEFIRGWDNARGADPYRVMLSWQNFAIQSHNHAINSRTSFNGAGNITASVTHGTPQTGWTELAGDNETRPRNVAFMYIVKSE